MLTRKTAKLNVTRLEDRWNPATFQADLTTVGASASFFGGDGAQHTSPGIFQQFDGANLAQLDTFLAMDAASAEQGYNTDGVTQFDTIDADTHAILRSDLPLVDIGGVQYREFVLDLQEGNSPRARFVSLDDVKVFAGSTPTATGLNLTAKTLAGTTLVYDLDWQLGRSDIFDPVDNSVALDSKLGGRNTVDMLFYLPDSLLAASGDPYVYLYSKFGTSTMPGGNDLSTEGKAESWARGLGGVPVGPFAAGTISATDFSNSGSPAPAPAPPPTDTTSSSDSGTVWL
ncbi:MAG TPA: hypothetical protein VFG68_09955 [Fimbriiglobus sp.]|nr:hypothetical protein [Fimbriiglobus sp.]